MDTIKKTNPGGEGAHQKKSRLCSFILAKTEENVWDSENVLRKEKCNF